MDSQTLKIREITSKLGIIILVFMSTHPCTHGTCGQGQISLLEFPVNNHIPTTLNTKHHIDWSYIFSLVQQELPFLLLLLTSRKQSPKQK